MNYGVGRAIELHYIVTLAAWFCSLGHDMGPRRTPAAHPPHAIKHTITFIMKYRTKAKHYSSTMVMNSLLEGVFLFFLNKHDLNFHRIFIQ